MPYRPEITLIALIFFALSVWWMKVQLDKADEMDKSRERIAPIESLSLLLTMTYINVPLLFISGATAILSMLPLLRNH